MPVVGHSLDHTARDADTGGDRAGRTPQRGAAGLAVLPPTRWSVVARAGGTGETARGEALEHLARLYRPVLVRHLVCRMRLPPDRAEDLVQEFCARKLLERAVLNRASPVRGRFRSFIFKTFVNFVIGELRRERAVKRSPGSPSAARLDDLPALAAPGSAPGAAFDALWARQVISRAVERMRAECLAKGRRSLWELFDARLLRPLLEQAEPIPYDRLVERFKLRSPSEASNLLITAKRMFQQALREIVRETVADAGEVEVEIRELKRILAQ